MNGKNKRLVELFFTFFRIGAFTFGSGYAMIPLIQKEIVEKKKWLTDEDILEILAIAESTPGPIAINSATFVGYKSAGYLGAIVSTVAIVLPSFIVISLLAKILDQFSSNTYVQSAFIGIKAAVLALIISTLIKMAKQIEKTPLSLMVVTIDLVLVLFLKVNVIIAIICSGALGLLYQWVVLKEAE